MHVRIHIKLSVEDKCSGITSPKAVSAVAWCGRQNLNVFFLFLRTFENTFVNKWIMKFLKRLT